MVFGTFRNRRGVEGLEAGLYPGASARLGGMLIGGDVPRPAPAAESTGLRAVVQNG